MEAIPNVEPQKIYSPRVFSDIVGMSRSEIDNLSTTAPHYYKPFDLRKSPSSTKWRHIDNPVGKLKELQARIDRRILRRVEFPPTMFGGITGRSTRMSASLHVGQPCVVTLDLKSCFPRISNDEVIRALRKHLHLSSDIASCMTRLLTLERRLPQGSPASPAIANLTMIEMHNALSSLANSRGLNLSQYVDDIIISGEGAEEAISDIVGIIRRHGKELSMRKLRVMGRGERQEVNGIVVNTSLGAKRTFLSDTREMISKASLEAYPSARAIRQINGRIAYVRYLSKSQGAALMRYYQRRLAEASISTDPPRSVDTSSLVRDCKGFARHRRDE